MKHHVRTFACGAALLALAACGGKQTMASKSAAAYDEARKKGIPVRAGEHGGHEAAPGMDHAMDHATMPGMDHSTMPGMDHATMPGMDHATMPGMDHSAMPGMNHAAMPKMDHAAMAGMDHAHMAGMQHDMGAMQHGSMAGMQHGSMPNMNMQHMPAPAAPVEIAPPTTNAAIAGTRPASTLRQDEFDAPAPAAVDEAKKDHHHGGGGR